MDTALEGFLLGHVIYFPVSGTIGQPHACGPGTATHQ